MGSRNNSRTVSDDSMNISGSFQGKSTGSPVCIWVFLLDVSGVEGVLGVFQGVSGGFIGFENVFQGSLGRY